MNTRIWKIFSILSVFSVKHCLLLYLLLGVFFPPVPVRFFSSSIKLLSRDKLGRHLSQVTKINFINIGVSSVTFDHHSRTYLMSACKAKYISSSPTFMYRTPLRFIRVCSQSLYSHNNFSSVRNHVDFSDRLYSSFKCPVIWSTKLLGAGPTPSTVRLPASICVRPASAITSEVTPRLRALPMSSSISS